MTYEVKITEYRYSCLINAEKESQELFEKIVKSYTKEFIRSVVGDEWRDNYDDSISLFVNDCIKRDCIVFNNSTPKVWFNGMGHGNMMYWGYNGSKTITINDIINP